MCLLLVKNMVRMTLIYSGIENWLSQLSAKVRSTEKLFDDHFAKIGLLPVSSFVL